MSKIDVRLHLNRAYLAGIFQNLFLVFLAIPRNETFIALEHTNKPQNASLELKLDIISLSSQEISWKNSIDQLHLVRPADAVMLHYSPYPIPEIQNQEFRKEGQLSRDDYGRA